MQALLEEDLSETMQLLDNAHSAYRHKNSQQAQQLKEKRQEADKLKSSAQLVYHKAENISFMKVGEGPPLPYLRLTHVMFQHDIKHTHTHTGTYSKAGNLRVHNGGQTNLQMICGFARVV